MLIWQEEYFLIWNRQNFWDRNFTGKAIYFGHTPSKKDDNTIVYYPNNCTCIDLGTYKYHKMVGVEIKSKMEYYIDEKYIYNGNDKERFEEIDFIKIILKELPFYDKNYFNWR